MGITIKRTTGEYEAMAMLLDMTYRPSIHVFQRYYDGADEWYEPDTMEPLEIGPVKYAKRWQEVAKINKRRYNEIVERNYQKALSVHGSPLAGTPSQTRSDQPQAITREGKAGGDGTGGGCAGKAAREVG